MENRIIELKDSILVQISDVNNDIPMPIGSSGRNTIQKVEGCFADIIDLIINWYE